MRTDLVVMASFPFTIFVCGSGFSHCFSSSILYSQSLPPAATPQTNSLPRPRFLTKSPYLLLLLYHKFLYTHILYFPPVCALIPPSIAYSKKTTHFASCNYYASPCNFSCTLKRRRFEVPLFPHYHILLQNQDAGR